MRKILFTVATLALASCNGSSNPSAATPAAPTNQTQVTTPPVLSDYKPLSAQQIFAAQYSKVDLICSVFTVDHESVLATDDPTQMFTIPVFPEANITNAFEATTKSGEMTVTGSVTAKLETLDMKAGDQIIGQSPVVEVSGDATAALNNKLVQTVKTTLGGVIDFTTPSSDFPVGGMEVSNDNKVLNTEYDGDFEVMCRLDGTLLKQEKQDDKK